MFVLVSTGLAQEDATYWDLRKADQPGQITIYDGPAYASSTGKPVEGADFNGNGCGDVAITGQNARNGAGQVRVVFDLCERWGSVIDIIEPDADAPPILNIWGAQEGDMFGTEVAHGDFNGDGYADLLVGAQNGNLPNRSRDRAGAIVVIFGSPTLHQTSTINLATPPDNVLIIYGADPIDRFGIWVSAGDVDGDGFDDLLVGANQADGLDNRRANAGEVFVIYGAADLQPTDGVALDMRDMALPMTRIIGADYDDLFGSTVYAGDLNMDGVADIIASAALWRGSAGVGGLSFGGGDGPANTRYNSGETFIIFGSPDLRGETLDLQALLDENGTPTTERIAVVYGPEANDLMGEEIVVGDLTGDGLNELVVGSLATPGRDNRRVDGGEAWVIDGRENWGGLAIDLAEPGAGVPIYAATQDSKGGDTLLLFDIDLDGYGDLLYGAPNANVIEPNGNERPNAGILVILYGTPNGLATTDGLIDLAAPPPDLRLSYLAGADPFDMSAYAMSSMDIDGDGYPDVIMNGMNGDGPNNRRTDAGEIYIISGKAFSESQGHQEVIDITTPAAPPTPFPTNTPFAVATITSNGTDLPLATGQSLYERSCAGCHGFKGEGVAGIAVPLVGSAYLDPTQVDDAAVLTFIRVGRSADDPQNISGRPMPPSGGNPTLTDAEILAIVRYLRQLED